MTPPKPPTRPDKVSLLRYVRLFRQDILSAQPARLYRAWMAEFKTPFFRSYLCNDPDLVNRVLQERPDDFPKSNRIREGLNPLLGNSVFVTNGDVWKRQRRIIDPAFEGGRLRDTFPAMLAAGQAAVARMPEGEVEVEEEVELEVEGEVELEAGVEVEVEGEVELEVEAEGASRPCSTSTRTTSANGSTPAGATPAGSTPAGPTPGSPNNSMRYSRSSGRLSPAPAASIVAPAIALIR